MRLRYELIDNTDFGSGPQDNGGYLLTRFMPYAALTLPNLPAGWELQLFAQFEAAFSDYDERGPGPIDQDDFDVIQAFAKISVPLGTGALSFQGGRQEISFGTERLLGTRYGPNVPLSFDGGLVRWKDPFWDFHGFYLRPVQVTPDLLDNLSGADQQLWGLYLTRRLDGMLSFVSKAAVDLYYIGFFDAAATYKAGPVASCGTPLARDSSEVGRSALECSTGTTKACCSSAVSTASVVMVASSPGAWERKLATRSTLSPNRGFPCEPT